MDTEQEDVVLQFERILGEGSFGVVYLVKDTDTDTRYAVKRISFRGHEKDRQTALNEADILSKIQHPHILQYIESFEDEDCLNIVTEYCEGGDLETYLHRRRKKKVPENRFVPWIFQIASALKYLHEKKILHRDLKTKNIFLMRDLSVKVGDLGIAKVLDLHQSKAQSFVGTPSYMSPELFLNIPYNQKSDIWSLGCCAFEMVAFEKAFGSNGLFGVVQKVMSGKLPNLPPGNSEALQEVIHSMLQKEPDVRPTADDIMQHPYIQKYSNMTGDNHEEYLDDDYSYFSRQDSSTYNDSLQTDQLKNNKSHMNDNYRKKKRPLKRSKTLSSSWGQVKQHIHKQEMESQSYAIARTMGKMEALKLNKPKNVWDSNSVLVGSDTLTDVKDSELDTFVVHSDQFEYTEEDTENSGTFVRHETVKDDLLSGKTPEMAAKMMVQGLKDRLMSFDGLDDAEIDTHAQVAVPFTEKDNDDSLTSQVDEQKPVRKKKKKKNILQKVSERKRLSSDSGDTGSSTSDTKEVNPQGAQKDEKVTLFTRSQQVSFKKLEDESEDPVDDKTTDADEEVQMRRKKVGDEKWKPFEKRKTTASLRNLVEFIGSAEHRTLVMEQIPILQKELTEELGRDTLNKCYEIMMSVEDDTIIKAVLRDLLGPAKFDIVGEELFILRMMELSACAKD